MPQKKTKRDRKGLAYVAGTASMLPAGLVGPLPAIGALRGGKPHIREYKQLRRIAHRRGLKFEGAPTAINPMLDRPMWRGVRRSLGRYSALAGYYNPATQSIFAHPGNAEILAHEMGHAALHKRLGRLSKPALYARPVGMAAAGLSPLLATGLDRDSKAHRYLPYVPFAAAAPTLADEAIASLHGYRSLKRIGANKALLRQARRTLPAAFLSYLAGPAAASLGVRVVQRVRGIERGKEKTKRAGMGELFRASWAARKELPEETQKAIRQQMMARAAIQGGFMGGGYALGTSTGKGMAGRKEKRPRWTPGAVAGSIFLPGGLMYQIGKRRGYRKATQKKASSDIFLGELISLALG